MFSTAARGRAAEACGIGCYFFTNYSAAVEKINYCRAAGTMGMQFPPPPGRGFSTPAASNTYDMSDTAKNNREKLALS
jgi:hypothetical protein